MKSTMDSIFKVGFGVELDTLSGSNEQGRIFARAFDDSSAQILHRYFDVFWKAKRFLNIGSEARMKKNIKVIDEFVYRLIDERIEQRTKQQNDSVSHTGDHAILIPAAHSARTLIVVSFWQMAKEDILSRFLIERERDPDRMSYKYLRDIVLNFLIAGRDTTAGTLAWLFYMLCKHPVAQEKVAREVREASNTEVEATMDEFVTSLTEEALNRMRYLHASITETLRLYPAVPLVIICIFAD